MNRRDFAKYSSAYMGGLMTLPIDSNREINAIDEKRLPRLLSPGDTIALIAPGSSISDEKIEKAKTNLMALGLKVREGKYIREKYGYTAGKDNERIADIHWAFSDPTIDGIWCVRGGYGCTRLLPYLDYALIKKNPKILIGYSDITALHLAIYKKTGLTTFHGPVGSSKFTNFTTEHLQKMFFKPTEGQNIQHLDPSKVVVLSSGTAKGKLIGGNLSLVSAMCGTAYLPSAKGKIVFLEDVEEKPYSIDRMLIQLEQAWDLKKAKGILLGEFADCDSESDRSLTLLETLENHFKDCGIPVLYNVPFGHIDDQATLPIGIKVSMHTKTKDIIFLENWIK